MDVYMSFCIPAYNNERDIGGAIRNILNSKHEDIECVIFYDKSNDNTLNRIKEINSNKIKIIYNTTKLAYGDMMLKCISSGSGKYAMYVICSDTLAMYDVDNVIDYLKSNEDIGCGLCGEVNGSQVIRYSPGETAISAVGYLQNHPTANIYNTRILNEAILSLKKIKYMNFPLDFLNAYIAQKYPCIVYGKLCRNAICFSDFEVLTKSSTSKITEWYKPLGRAMNMYWSLVHLSRLDLKENSKQKIAKILYKRALNYSVDGYARIKMDVALHIHYGFSMERIGFFKKILAQLICIIFFIKWKFFRTLNK